MVSTLTSATLLGIQAIAIDVEVHATRGLPKETIVGLPDTVIKESKNRIISAIKNSGFDYPCKSYTINLAPAELKKEGAILDLAIAIAILDATGQWSANKQALYVGELSLDGHLRPIRGILSICDMAKKKGIKTLFMPKENVSDAALISGITYYPIQHLSDITSSTIKPYKACTKHIEKRQKDIEKNPPLYGDFNDVKGQLMTKRALEIAAAGRHNFLLIGSPGSGKSMLCQRFPSILPPLTLDQYIETYKIHSSRRYTHSTHMPSFSSPFRTPHHTTSYAGMTGGGQNAQPGEISMAHHGVLFLDELPEFQRPVIEALRQPMETHNITLSRAHYTISYPAHFLLAAAMNPCPCGYHLDPDKDCQCHPSQIKKYWKKISGPILDRIDIILHVPKLNKKDLFTKQNPNTNPYTSEKMEHRILHCRTIQKNRYKAPICNADLSPNMIDQHCPLSADAISFLNATLTKNNLTGRSFHKLLKVARTIADLDNQDRISLDHLSESLHYQRR